MAYIGKSIESGTFSVLDTSGNTYNGSNVTFNLGTQVGSPAQLLVSHDGVIQKPGTDYSLATGGTQITFSTAPASGASIFIVEISGAVGGPLDSDLNGTELILDADGDTSITADTDDQIDVKIAGADDFSFTANTFTAASGSTIAGQAITATTVVGSGAAQFATAGIGAAKDLGVGLHIKTADSSASANADADELVIENGTSGAGVGISLLSATNGEARLNFGDSGDDNIGQIFYNHGNNSMSFLVNAATSMLIDSSGHLKIGGADNTVGANCAITNNTTETTLEIQNEATSGTHRCVDFRNGDGDIAGSININTSGDAVSFETSSDYRLKENVVDLTGAITRVKNLKPKRFNFKVDTDTTLDGFLAHEAQSVVPEAVSGTKDETETRKNIVVNAKGNVKSCNITEEEWTQGKSIGEFANDTQWFASKEFMVKQGIDQAKLVPLLTAALQEAITKIETLETKVTALEG